MTCLPSGAREHNDAGGQALKGGLDGADGYGLCRVFAVRRGAAQVLEHLPVEHGRLGFAGDLPCASSEVEGKADVKVGKRAGRRGREKKDGNTGLDRLQG